MYNSDQTNISVKVFENLKLCNRHFKEFWWTVWRTVSKKTWKKWNYLKTSQEKYCNILFFFPFHLFIILCWWCCLVFVQAYCTCETWSLPCILSSAAFWEHFIYRMQSGTFCTSLLNQITIVFTILVFLVQ